ncbi:MAG: GntR family transcriptional regulator [Pseudomonadota bacterium]
MTGDGADAMGGEDRALDDRAGEPGPAREPAPSSLPPAAKSRHVYLQLRDDILSGRRAAGSTLPSEPKLAEALGVGRVTLRRALERLADEGLIERRAGSGTRVCGPARGRDAQAIKADVVTLMPQLEEMDRRTSARLLSFAYVEAPAPIAAGLGLDEGASVQRAVRVRSFDAAGGADGAPFSHLTTHVPAELARAYSEADLATTPLFRLLERGGARIAGATQTVSAALATPQVAEALDVEPGAPLIALTRIVRDAAGRGVEHLQALYRPDRYRFEMTLARVGAGDARHWSPVVVAGDAA